MAWNLEEALSYYQKMGAPADQNALIQLLREIQKEHSGIPAYMLQTIADRYGMKESILHALIRRIPSLRLAQKHCLEICTGKVCGASAVLAALAEGLASDSIAVRFVPCMRQCGEGPNIRWDGTLFNKADESLIQTLIKSKN